MICISGGTVLEMRGRTRSLKEGKEIVLKLLKSGEALEKFHSMLICQGVAEETATNLCHGDMYSVLPSVPTNHITITKAYSSGNVPDRI
jgi:thymidine phosphorylase